MEDTAQILRFGLSEVYAPSPASKAQVDVVFVHGLNGDPKLTWTSKSGSVFWPKDLLPQFVEDFNVRLLVYGYDADIVSFATKGTGVTKDKIHNHAERLVADLFANRRIRKAAERPIIFVAHSLGGLVVKRALIYSSEITGIKTEHLRSVGVSTYGAFFLGTPHRGSDLGQWGSYLESVSSAIIPKKFLDSQPNLVEALKTNSETLQNIDRQFSMLMDKYHLYFFHEGKPTDMKGTRRFIVEEESAAPSLPDVERASIPADHSSMCKFSNENSPGFDLIVDGIQRYAEEAPATIKQRWLAEKQERLTQKLRKAKELVPGAIDNLKLPEDSTIDSPSSAVSPSTSLLDIRDSTFAKHVSAATSSSLLSTASRPSEPFFVVPPGFRMNPVFVGMQRELRLLDSLLFDDRREVGPATVLIHGPPGGGKSHIVRQYIHDNRAKFPGGVFWIHSHSIGEVENDFWQIAQKAIAKVAPEMMLNIQDPSHAYADTVREWFEGRQDWLIVLDGLAMEKDENLEKLYRFIPDCPNSSTIYVSRSSRFAGIDRLFNPTTIKVRPLQEEEGQELLFKELHIDKPRPAQLRSASELVEKIGGLPLAINAIAKRIIDTRVPLEKFSMKSYSTDPVLGGTYRMVMDDLRKNRHSEALNLISIICFFGPHIPVEMIHLGVGALKNMDIDIASSENGEEPDLNTTLSILMRHALIERNEPDDNSSLSNSHDSLLEPDPIDMIKMHTVAQRFCSDSLNASKRLSIWLNHACQVLTCSYREADARIRSRPESGRVSDYRSYSIHGQQLRQHTINYESKKNSLEHIRRELDAILTEIDERIRVLEPRSSQESVVQKEFQCSIFDRTNIISSSSNTQSELASSTYSASRLSEIEAKPLRDMSRSDVDASFEAGESHISLPPSNFISRDGKFLSTEPIQRNLSDSSTIRPSMHDSITYKEKDRSRPPMPLTKISTQAALGSPSRASHEEHKAIEATSDAHSSLVNVSKRKEHNSTWFGSWWPKLAAYDKPNSSVPAFQRTGEDDLGTHDTQVPSRGPATLTFPRYQATLLPLTYARGKTDPRLNLQLRAGQGTPLKAEVVLPKSPLAEPAVSPSYGLLHWDTLGATQERSINAAEIPIKASIGSTATLVPSPGNASQQQVLIGSSPHPLVIENIKPITARPEDLLKPVVAIPVSTLSTTVSDAAIALPMQSVKTSDDESGSAYNLQGLLVKPTEQVQLTPDPSALNQYKSVVSCQSPLIEQNPTNNGAHFQRSDVSPLQKALNFASTNSSPANAPHVFSSSHSDFASTLSGGRDISLSQSKPSTGAPTSRWADTSQATIQPQVQSAPLLYSQFPIDSTNPQVFTHVASSATLSNSAMQQRTSQSSQSNSNHGLGIANYSESTPLAGLAIVPASDPRRRLRAREGRLQDRDVSILVRPASEIEHPLAPIVGQSAAAIARTATENNPAILELKSPDGKTVIASTELRNRKPVERNVGTRSSAPYTEMNLMQMARNNLSAETLIMDTGPGHQRRRSAPESPAWSGGDAAGWLGQG